MPFGRTVQVTKTKIKISKDGAAPDAPAPPQATPVWYPFGAGQAWGVPTLPAAPARPAPAPGVKDKAEQAQAFLDKQWDRRVAPAAEQAALPQQFVSLAAVLQSASEHAADLDDKGSFLHTEGAHTLGALGAATSAVGVVGAGRTVFSGAKNLRAGYTGYQQGDDAEPVANSIDTNLGAVQLEKGITAGLTGIMGMGVSGGYAGTGSVPIAGAVTNLVNAGLSTKAAVEDATASGKLGYQRRQARLDTERQLPMRFRVQRFRAFLREYQAHAREKGNRAQLGKRGTPATWWTSQRNGYARFAKAAADYRTTNAHDDPSDLTVNPDHYDPTAFLDYLDKHKINEFGHAGEPADDHETYRKAKGNDDVPDEWRGYVDSRSLGKVSAFAQRRKAETATLSSIDAAGNVVEGVGNITAGADYGITKAVGKAVKLTKGSYVQTKKVGKRARRVHKLRTAKNEMGYGGTQRGVIWGSRQFFAGNVDAQMTSARKSLVSGGARGQDFKESTKVAGMDDAAKNDLLRTLTKQCDRRINDLLRCLVTGNDDVYHRAKAILHVIAETNLAGALQKINDSDLDRYRDLYWLAQDRAAAAPHDPLAQPLDADTLARHRAEFTRRSNQLRTIVASQLQGVGG